MVRLCFRRLFCGFHLINVFFLAFIKCANSTNLDTEQN